MTLRDALLSSDKACMQLMYSSGVTHYDEMEEITKLVIDNELSVSKLESFLQVRKGEPIITLTDVKLIQDSYGKVWVKSTRSLFTSIRLEELVQRFDKGWSASSFCIWAMGIKDNSNVNNKYFAPENLHAKFFEHRVIEIKKASLLYQDFIENNVRSGSKATFTQAAEGLKKLEAMFNKQALAELFDKFRSINYETLPNF